jgi:hypothetical protein
LRLLIGILFTFAFAAATGLGATWLAVSHGYGFGDVTLGPWRAMPRSGSTSIDPFARAALARSGELPLGSGDGIAFFARTDGAGQPLDGRCEVTLSGLTPVARYWTLTLYDAEGGLVPNALGRHGFTSAETVRASDGRFRIVIAPRSRPGNWLPSGGVQQYVLALRLYDSTVGVATHVGRDAALPTLERGACP